MKAGRFNQKATSAQLKFIYFTYTAINGRLLYILIAGGLSALLVSSGCRTNSNQPPYELIKKESGLPVATTDSVEYYQLSERDIWDFGQRTPFRAILYFDDQAYQSILQKVKQDTSYSPYRSEKEIAKSFSIYFKKYLSPTPKCSMEDDMYLYNGKKSETIVFCNRIHFIFSNLSPFD